MLLMKTTYSEKLRHPKWQRKRLEVMARDSFSCRCCGDKETTLNVHHVKYTGEPWEVPQDDLITLCEHCHEAIEVTKVDIRDAVVYKIMGTLFIITGHGMVVFKPGEKAVIVEVANESLRAIVQMVINKWLDSGNEHFLVDRKIA